MYSAIQASCNIANGVEMIQLCSITGCRSRLEQQLAEAEAAKKTMEQDLFGGSEQRDTLSAEVGALKAAAQESAKAIEQLQDTLRATEAARSQVASSLDDSQTNLEAAQYEITQRSEQLATATATNEQYSDQSLQLQAQLQQAKSESEQNIDRVESLAVLVDDGAAENQTLSKELDE